MYRELAELINDWLGTEYQIFFGNNEKPVDDYLKSNNIQGAKSLGVIRITSSERGLNGADYSELTSYSMDLVLPIEKESEEIVNIRDTVSKYQSAEFYLNDGKELTYTIEFDTIANNGDTIVCNGQKYSIYTLAFNVYSHDGLLMSNSVSLKINGNQLNGVIQYVEGSSLTYNLEKTNGQLIGDIVEEQLSRVFEITYQPRVNSEANNILFELHNQKSLSDNFRKCTLTKSWQTLLNEEIEVKMLDFNVRLSFGTPAMITVKLQEIV